MDDFRICGSCRTMVTAPAGPGVCPRCTGPLEPSSEEVLRRFIDVGINEVNRRGGVVEREARDAADKVLGALLHTRIKLNRHHIGDACTECDE